jgi:hypothetical protein
LPEAWLKLDQSEGDPIASGMEKGLEVGKNFAFSIPVLSCDASQGWKVANRAGKRFHWGARKSVSGGQAEG